MQRHGWTLLFHDCVAEQLQKLDIAARRAEQNDPQGFESNANVKLINALSHLMLEVVPSRSEEHTSELQSLMRTSYAAFLLKTKNIICLKKKQTHKTLGDQTNTQTK